LSNLSFANRPETGESARDLRGPNRHRGITSENAPRNLHVRIASSDRAISTAGRIVTISEVGATVEVMFPSRGPSVIMLYLIDESQIYECEVRWRTDWRIGVRFLDILGPMRRRLYFSDQPVPLQTLPNRILRLADAPREGVVPEAPTSNAGPTPQDPRVAALQDWIRAIRKD